MDAVQGSATTVAASTSIGQLFLGASLKLLWGLINTLQFIVFFSDWQVQMPENAAGAIKMIRTFALGEFIPYEWLTDPIARIFETEKD